MKFLATLFTLSAWFRSRKYKSGTGWCFFRWTDVRSEYILRLHVVKTPWFAVCLHWIRKPDPEPWLHDHPVSFLSLILRGKYAELRQGMGDLGPHFVVHRWFNFIRACEHDRHKIMFTRTNTLTLCFMGPKTREWGYHTDRGWLHWKEYEKQRREEEPPLDKFTWGVFWKKLDERVDEMSRKFIATHDSRITLDEDTRPVDTRTPADFAAEEVTAPRPLPEYTPELRDGTSNFYKAEDGCWYWRGIDNTVHGPFHGRADAARDRRAFYEVTDV